jgi:hypothetical protein
MKYPRLITSFVLFLSIALSAQSSFPELQKYKNFLESHAGLTAAGIQEMYDAGSFRNRIYSSSDFQYLDSIDIKYELTDYEKNILNEHGFMVTERLSGPSFGNRFLDIYHKDLPVFISSDAILHAFHVSYDQILKEVELGLLIDKLTALLSGMKANILVLESQNSSMPAAEQNLKDVDVYLTVALKLLKGDETPYYADNAETINELMNYIKSEDLQEIPFFSTTSRKIDFSQFKIRGHYEDEYYPELGRYFQAMIWLGRMELYLIGPETVENKPTRAEVQRQTIDALLIADLMNSANQTNNYHEFESVITSFVGEQDNVTFDNLETLKESLNITSSFELSDSIKFDEFQAELSQQSFAFQRILSQVLMNNPSTPDSIKPASAFMLFGQRFIIDSYVTGNVVYDKIKHNGQYIRRMLPSTLDILFALGNDAAAQLLQDELDEYKYAPNLAGLRYLIDNHDEEFWNVSIYNSWLNAIRSLNPPENRDDLPAFMQTAAWWQQKMNGQLAAWTELRHDNLLYGKQSYTGGITCSYPYSYVEPVPDFFYKMGELVSNASDRISQIPFDNEDYKNHVIYFFNNFKNTTDTLAVIAEKELSGKQFNEAEIQFLQSMLSEIPMCGGAYNGWYVKLFYPYEYEEGLLKEDRVVADYHTAPTDASGYFIGWVKHAGTGAVDMAVVTTSLPNGQQTAFVGPVLSYHEYTTTNFQRISDSEWKESYYSQSTRPDWVNIYLADKQGAALGEGLQLITGTETDNNDNHIPESHILASNYPNPFNNGTVINYTVPSSLANQQTKVIIYNFLGEEIAKLVDNVLPAGNYLTRWYGKDNNGNIVSSGVYFYSVRIGSEQFVGKMNLLK